jgi:hypothetical protein
MDVPNFKSYYIKKQFIIIEPGEYSIDQILSLLNRYEYVLISKSPNVRFNFYQRAHGMYHILGCYSQRINNIEYLSKHKLNLNHNDNCCNIL